MHTGKNHILFGETVFHGLNNCLVFSRRGYHVAFREETLRTNYGKPAGAGFHLMIFETPHNLLCAFHIHVREEQLAECLAFHNRSVEQFQETVHTDFFVIRIRIDCPELLCRLNKPPLVKRGLL